MTMAISIEMALLTLLKAVQERQLSIQAPALSWTM